MPILVIDTHCPANRNQGVPAAWLGALEKYTRSEDLGKPLVENAVTSGQVGTRVFSATDKSQAVSKWKLTVAVPEGKQMAALEGTGNWIKGSAKPVERSRMQLATGTENPYP
jgi:hypothetical protein